MWKKLITITLIAGFLSQAQFVLSQPASSGGQSEKVENNNLQKAIELYDTAPGKLEEVSIILNLLIESGKLSNKDKRVAYQYLIASTILSKQLDNARLVILHALQIDPNLTLNRADWNPDVVGYFNLVKADVVGSLRIQSEPNEVNVFLNDSLAGRTPLFFQCMVTGQYKVYLFKTGYRPRIDTVEVFPSKLNILDRPLKRNYNPWLWGAVGVMAAGTAAYFILKPGSKTSSALVPLGQPPAHP